MIGKKAQIGDYLAFAIFIGGLMFLFVLCFFIIKPSTGGKAAYDVKVEIEDISNNLFLYGFLRQDMGNKNMVDLIALSYTNKDYNELKEETIKILKKIQKNVNFRIYINKEKVIEECTTKCKGKEEEFATMLPVPNKEVINFRLVLYEAK